VRFGANELGAVEGERVVALTGIASSMIELISGWPVLRAEAERRLREAARSFPLSEVRLKAPIARPGKILAIGLNYADHIAETKAQKPEFQTWFAKMPTAANGPYDPILIPRGAETVDYEAELVVVIGKGGRHISAAGAPGAIFGYCCGNDVTERTWQKRTSQWIVGKSCDTHAPFGPWITTADEISDPHALGIRCLVNGETRQDSSTAKLIFNLWEQIAFLSRAMTLEPGDLLFTGTPNGVGMAMTPPRFLKSGDRVRVEIDKLGALDAEMAAEG
jgi:2-keto-4-pentenoate hydratase/2-oxohepta-3-ene-1,7-dioic acid hydratase in catechol pathway